MSPPVALASWIGVAALVAASPAKADGADRLAAAPQCAAAFQKANDHLHASELVAAVGQFHICARSPCETFLQHECLVAAMRIEADIPTILLDVKDAAGVRQSDVEVKMDTQVLASRIDDQPIAVDPGAHTFEFSAGGAAFASQRVLIVQGQRNRLISALMAAPTIPRVAADVSTAKSAPASAFSETSSTETDEHPARSPFPFLIGGLVGASATAAVLTLSGDRSASSVISDASIGLSVGALIVAVWLFTADRAARPNSSRTGARVDARKSTSTAMGSLVHGF